MIRRALWTPAVPCGPGVCRLVWGRSGSFCKVLGLCISSYSLKLCVWWRDPLSVLCPVVVGMGLPVQPGCGLAQTSLWLLPEYRIFISQSQALLQVYDPCTAWGLSFHAERRWHNSAPFWSGDLHLVSHSSPTLPLLVQKYRLNSSHQHTFLMGLLVACGE